MVHLKDVNKCCSSWGQSSREKSVLEQVSEPAYSVAHVKVQGLDFEGCPVNGQVCDMTRFAFPVFTLGRRMGSGGKAEDTRRPIGKLLQQLR